MDGPTPNVTLPTPIIPNADSNGGIGAVDVEDGAKGVIVSVGPWQGMTTGDVINVFWGKNTPSATNYIVDAERQAILLRGPAEIVAQNRTEFVEVSCTVDLYPSARKEISRPVSVRDDLTIPGSRDPLPAMIGDVLILPGGDVNRGHEVLRTAPAGRAIRHLEIRSKDVIWLDFFKFKGKA